MSFGTYIKQLSKFALSSSLVMGLIVGVALLLSGGSTMEIDLTFEFGRYDGIWFVIGLPILSMFFLLVLSPVSFLIHRLLSGNREEGEQPAP